MESGNEITSWHTDINNKDKILTAETDKLSSDGQHTSFAIWLDVRVTHRNQVFGASSLDGGKSWQKNILIYASRIDTFANAVSPQLK